MKKRWSKIAVLLLALILLVGCSAPAATDETPAPTEAAEATKAPDTATEKPAATEKVTAATPEPVQATPEPMTYKQAPYWDENPTWMGKTLPPVEERLPDVPKFANELPDSFFPGGKIEVGKYGGTMRMLNASVDWNPDLFLMFNEPIISSPGTLGAQVLPNIVENYEVSDDMKEFTFKMRKGLKWSDGVPVTMDDVKFAIEDVMFNEELNTAGPPNTYKSGGTKTGTPMTFTVVDDWTFKLSFDQPYGKFTLKVGIAGWVGYTDLIIPSHHVKKWHTKYGDAAEIQAKGEERKLAEDFKWIDVYREMEITNWEIPNIKAIEYPSLLPFIMTKATDTTREYTRNPYYYKIDADGQQLPYIDYILSSYVGDIEVINVQVLAGEADMLRESASLSKIALYRENSERGGFIAPMLGVHVDNTHFIINQTYDYEEKTNYGKLIRTLDFRIALQLGMNNQEIIDSLYFGYVEPSVISRFEFDPDQANTLLDGLGLTKGADGMRTGADGKKIQIMFETTNSMPEWPQACDLVSQQWRENLGIDASTKSIDGNLHGERNNANELQGYATWIHIPLLRAGWSTDLTRPGGDARLWYMFMETAGEQGEEPPDWYQRIYNIESDYMKTLPGSPEDQTLVDELYKLYYDNALRIQLGANFKQPIILNAKFGNVPTDGMCVAADIAGEIFYFKE